jgi:hypothetical protein
MAQLVKSQSAWLEKQKQAGNLLEAYYLPGCLRNITVWEFESAEAIDKHFRDDPLSSAFDWEIHPATDLFEHFKSRGRAP